MINEKKLIEDLKGYKIDNISVNGKNIIDIIEEQPKTDWIPCKERSPKILQWVLIQTTQGDMDVVRYLGETECWGNDFYHKIHPRMVIAWQPLPQPYKKEGAESE